MATRYDPTANTQYPVSSQTASLRASQAATNAQLAAQNAAITASQRPSATASGNPTPSVTAAQLARIQNTYTTAQPSVTSSLSSRPFRDPTTAQVAAQGASNGVRPSLTESPRAAQQQAQASANAQQYVKNLAGSYNANDARQQVQASNAARAAVQQEVGRYNPNAAQSDVAASNDARIANLQSIYSGVDASGSPSGSLASDYRRALYDPNSGTYRSSATPAATASTTAEAPAAETPAAEAPKATMYTPTTLAAKSASTAAPAATPAATPASTVATQTATTTAAKPVATTTPAATTAPAATNSPAATTTKSNSGSESVTQNAPVEYTPTGMYDLNNLRAYNEQRVADIRSIYDDALRANLASMQRAYDQNMSDAEAARDLISPQYQRSMNSLSAEYERQRRNNNMQAAANGLNTGAGSQMALAQSANYQANQAGLAAKENEALNEANRRIGDLQRNYQNAIAEATANNNYKLAASLMEEYQNAYNRQLQIENTNYQRAQQAEQQNYTRSWNEDERSYSRGVDEAGRKAQYGDFSGYKDLYGDEIANLMELTWAMQNPDVAWASGKLSAEDYMALTGRQPVNPTAADTTGLGVGYGASSGYSNNDYMIGHPGEAGYVSGRGAGGGYSSGGSRGRSGGASGYGKGYNGPPGYYNEAGQFIVPDGNGGVAASYGSAQGADRYNTNPNVNGNVSAQGAKDYAEAYAKAYGSGGGSSGGSYTGSGGGDTGGGNDSAPTQTWSEKLSGLASKLFG